ncbi:MAG: hypothetical protein Q4D90_06060 [bacterium]|nr:hypothetical protein [bacterium]
MVSSNPEKVHSVHGNDGNDGIEKIACVSNVRMAGRYRDETVRRSERLYGEGRPLLC